LTIELSVENGTCSSFYLYPFCVYQKIMKSASLETKLNIFQGKKEHSK